VIRSSFEFETINTPIRLHRRDLLGGLIHESKRPEFANPTGLRCLRGWLRPSRSPGAGAGHGRAYVQARSGRDAPRLSHQL
jgi:hypothetical protein